MENVLNSTNSSKEINETIHLLDLVELKDLQKIQDTFAEANEVASIITDLNGNPITEASNFCEVCKLVRQTEKGLKNCYKSDKLLGEHSIKTMKPHYEKCHSCGFIDAAAPIIVENKVIAHWLIGQSNIADVDENKISAYAEEIGADKEEVLKAYRKMSNMSLNKFEKITDLLWILANEISNKSYTNLKLARELKKSQQTEKSLQENIQKLQESEKKLQQKQQELIESQALLNNIIEQAPTGVFAIKAPDMNVFITNKAASEITGLKTDNKTSETIDNFDFNYKHLYPDRTPYKPEDIPVARVFRNQEVIKNEEMILQFSDGKEKWIHVNTSPVYDNNNKLIAVTAAFTDITERKNLEKELIAQNNLLLKKEEKLITQNKKLQSKEEKLIAQNEELQTKEEELISQNKELNKKQQELIESQALLNNIIEKAPAGILVGKTPDMKICISNQLANTITGQTLEDWSKINNDNIALKFKIHYPDGTPYKDDDLPFIRSFRNQETIQNIEQLIKLTDGTEKSVIISTTPVFDDNNNLTAVIGIFNDITERKKLEKDLLESQALLNSIIEQAPTGVLAAKAPDMELFITNKAANEITGLKTNNWTTITLNNIDLHYENFYPDRTPYNLEDLPLPRAYRDQEIIKNEKILLKLYDGTEKWVQVNASPVYDNNNNLIAATAVFSDITEQTKLEEKLISQNEDLQTKEEELIAQNEELQSKEEELIAQNEELQIKQNELIESQALLKSIIEQAPTGVLVGKAPDMQICVINKAAAEISGLSIEDWSKINVNQLNLNYESFYPDGSKYKPEDLPLPRAIKDQKVTINEETKIKLADGTEKWALVNASPVYDNDNNLIAAAAVFSDITERKKLEEELIESQILFKSILDQAPTGVLTIKAPDMSFAITNKAATDILNYSIETGPETILENENKSFTALKVDKTEYDVNEIPIVRAYKTQEIINNEEMCLQFNDGTEKYILINASPVYDANNNIIASTAVFSEITDHKKLEKELIAHKNNLEKEVQERTEELNITLNKYKTTNLRLEQANQHKNRFISSMSHELRTPLNAIIGFTQTLEKQYFGHLNEKQLEYITLVKNSGEHLLSLINDILNIAKIDSGSIEFTPENINAEKCISDIVSIMSAQFKDKKIHLDYSINDDVDLFYSDERKCKQILFNLLSNALKYTKEEGEVKINASKENDFVHISVIDNGIGIKEENIDKIFQEFYQSDEVRDQALGGVGIGLALTERLVKMHGGEIGVESKINEGSKFWFTVPVKND